MWRIIRSPSNNLYYLNLLFISYPKLSLIVMSSIIQYLLTKVTLLIECHHKWILMMYILNNATNQPSNGIKLKSDWKLISKPYLYHILWHWIECSPLWLNPHWKLVLNAYTCVPILQITKCGQSNHQIDNTAGSTLKISARCIYICTNSQKLSNLVSPITKLILWLNSHWKNGSQICITHPILNICKGFTQIGNFNEVEESDLKHLEEWTRDKQHAPEPIDLVHM